MDLGLYADRQKHGELTRLQRATGCGYAMLWLVAKTGKRLKNEKVAQRISDATDGEVTVADLIEPLPARVLKRLAKEREAEKTRRAAKRTAKAKKVAA